MNQSYFIELVQKYFAAIVGKITEKINGEDKEKPMLHKTALTTEYSADLNWGSTEINQSVVAADIVETNSSLPLKKRGTLGKATGKLPKLGMKYFKDEDDIDQINTMIAKGTKEAEIVSKLFDDVSKAIKGVDVRNEIMFLQALSSGVMLANDDNNTGTAVRLDFGFKNVLHATTAPWSQATATPTDDIEQLFEKADSDGNSIGHVWMSRKYFNYLRKSDAGKLLAANFLGHVITSTTTLSQPSKKDMLAALNDEYDATFHIVDYTARIENKDGSHKKITPWEEGAVIGTATENVGRLVYGTLAEETNPVGGVQYQKSGLYTLVAKYSETDPLKEFTTSQARCIPVIDNVSSIYKLDASATA